MDKKCALISKTRTFLSDPKLLNGRVASFDLKRCSDTTVTVQCNAVSSEHCKCCHYHHSSHSATAMKHSEAAVLMVADLADLFTEDSEALE